MHMVPVGISNFDETEKSLKFSLYFLWIHFDYIAWLYIMSSVTNNICMEEICQCYLSTWICDCWSLPQ